LRDFVYMKDCDGKYIVAQIHEIYLKELIEGEEPVLYGSFLPFAISDHGKILAMMPKKLQCPIDWIVKLVTVGTEEDKATKKNDLFSQVQNCKF